MDFPEPAPDGLRYVTGTTAARLVGVHKSTVTTWKNKGYLTPVAGSPPGKPVYLLDDVWDAEREARLNAARTTRSATGTTRQVQRNRGGS